VGRGEHGARGVERAGGVIQHVGRGEAEVDHVEPLFVHTSGERRDELLTRRAHVASDQHAVALAHGGEADPEGVRDISMELVGNGASDVVRLDDLIKDRHTGSRS
jgi:hypothetical protein